MAKPSIDVAELLARLSASTIFELRGEWRRLHRAPPPMRLSRELLMRGISYKLQERPLGGLSNDPAQTGTPEPRLAGKRRAKARTADFVDGRHAACARMARRHPYRACPCRRVRMERPALSVPHNCRPCDHRGPLVGSPFFRFEKVRRPLRRERGGRACGSLIARSPA